MPNLMFLCQSGIWPILCQLMAILTNYINFDIQTKFEVNRTKIGHSILQNTPKTRQSGHISKPNFA